MATGVAGDNRLLFMPHSPGVYLALVLKDGESIEKEQEDQLEMMSHISSSMGGDDSSQTPLKLAT